MRIVFLGSGEFGLPTLERLREVHEVALVVTQPDRPAGRKRTMTATPIGQWAAERHLPLTKPENVNEDEHLDRIRAAKPDAIVVIAFGQYLRQPLVDAAGGCGAMNLHASLLPKYRGAAPINWTLIQGETEAGNTVIRIASKMDAGDMLGQQTTPIDPAETAGELHDRLAAMGPELVLDVLQQCEGGTLAETSQDESQATLAPKLSKADGVIDWSQDATAIRCRVHGLTPWPGVTAHYRTEPAGEAKPLLLRRVADQPEAAIHAAPGTLIDPDQGIVAVGAGAVRLLEVQPPGKRTMNWADFQQGHQLPIETVFITR
jgi:methionyl-tRNA formyltransferase